jgi:hypothetical protein
MNLGKLIIKQVIFAIILFSYLPARIHANESFTARFKTNYLISVMSSDYTALQENLAPVLSGIEADNLIYNIGSGKINLTSSLILEDADNTNIVSATIKIKSGYTSTEDKLYYNGGGSISAILDETAGELNLTGDAPLNEYENALRSVQYENTNNINPTIAPKEIAIIVNDGTDNSNEVTRTINLIIPDVAPEISDIEANDLNYVEGSGKVVITSDISLSDTDNENLESATIVITNGYNNGEDILSLTDVDGITDNWDANTGTFSLAGTSSVANYQFALRNIQYENTNINSPSIETRTISYTVNDGTASSNTIARNIKISLANVAPLLSGIEAASLEYTEGSGELIVSESIDVTDEDNVDLQSATVAITSGYTNSQDILSFTNANGITGSWDAGSGTLTLTGSSSVANYQSALRSVQYQNTNNSNPSTTIRAISFTVNDGTAPSNTVSRNITIQHTNVAAVLSGIEGENLSYTEGSGKVNITGSIAVSDGDNTNLSSAMIIISAGYNNSQDVLSFTNATDITSSWDTGTGTMTLTGSSSVANYQSALRSVQYQNTNNSNPSTDPRTISFTVNDGTAPSNTVSRNITLQHTNVAPVLSGIEGDALSYSEGSGKVSISSSIAVSDGDNTNLNSAMIIILAGYDNSQDELSFTNANGISGSWDTGTGTLTLTGISSVANYQSALRSVQYQNTNNSNSSTTARTISFTVNDGTAPSNTLSRNITIQHTNVAPILSGIEGEALSYTEGSGKANITSSIAVSDADNTNLSLATIIILAGYDNSQDVLSFTNTNGITGSWDAGSGTLTLTGSSSVANYQSALRSVQYQNTNNSNPSTTARTISFAVNDGTAPSNTLSRNITIQHINVASILSGIEGEALSYTEGSGKANITSSIAVSDADNTNLSLATIIISAGYDNSQDVLSFTNTNGVTGSWDAGTGTLTLTGSSSVANYELALRNVQYQNTNSANPSTNPRTISFTVNDGTAPSNTLSRNINIQHINVAPVLSGIEGDALSYTEGSGKINITGSIAVSDGDNTNLNSATIMISAGYDISQDVLSFTNANGITSSWDAAIGTMTLTGSSSVANYQSALRSVQYQNTNNSNPSTTTRTISFAVNDGNAQSNTESRNITIQHTNVAPVLSGIEGGALSYTEGSGKVNISSSIAISDDDNTNLSSAKIIISAGYDNSQDELSFTNANGITGSWDVATGTLTLTGSSSVANYQSALRSVQYQNTNNSNPSITTRTISFTVNDGAALSNTEIRNITIQHINVAPILSGIEGDALSYTEGSGKVNITASIAVSDSDNTNLNSATIIISAGYDNSQDELSFTNANGITGSWDAGSGTLTLTGSSLVANYQSALRSVQYQNTNNSNPSTTTRTISFTVNDGTAPSNTETRNITIQHINVAPVLSGIEGDALSYTEGSGKVSISSSIAVSDDDNTNLSSATVIISAGYANSQDVLSFSDANGITGSWDTGTGTMTLTGSSSVANYQSALRSLQYQNTNNSNPSTTPRTISFTVSDGTAPSNKVSRNITLQHTNVAPVLSRIEEDALSYTEGSGKVNITASIAVSDSDNTNLNSATIIISAGYDNSQDVLSFTNANGITGSWDAGSGTLTLTGSSLVANYQSALRSVQYQNNNNSNPSTPTRTISFNVNDGIANSNTLSRSITITHTNLAPSISGIETAALSYNEGSGKVSITLTITIADEDNVNLQSATISVTTNYNSTQDVLSFSNANGITGLWDTSTGTMTLTGNANIANYQSALRSVQYENVNTTNPSTETRTVSFTINDGTANSNAVTRNIVVNHTNIPPTLSGIEEAALSYNEGSGKVAISSSLTITDPDNLNLQTATVMITSGYNSNQDVLSFTNANGITASWNEVSGTLTLSGSSTVENYQAALRNVQYENTNINNPSTITRTISFTVNDGVAASNNASRNISIHHSNIAPTLSSIEGTALSYNEGSGVVTITSSITVNDLDNTNLQSATVSITSGYNSSQDVLSFVNTNGITASWNSSAGVLILSGEASVADYQNALRNIQYENLNNILPSSDVRVVTFMVSDGAVNSNAVTRNIQVIHVNNAPVLAGIETVDMNFLIGQGAENITSAIAISDIDDSNLASATIKISSEYKQDEDILTVPVYANITGTWDPVTGTLVLSGEASLQDYQKALRNIKYDNFGTLPTLNKRTITITVNDGDANSNIQQRSIVFNSQPIVSNLNITGILSVCKTLTGSYTYSDAENDPEGYSTFRWLRAATIDGVKTPIPEAVSLTYTLTSEDNNQFIFFEVTPQSKTGSISGVPTISQPSGKIQNLLPTVTFSGITTICQGSQSDIKITFTGTAPFNLKYTDGVTVSEINASSATSYITAHKAATYSAVSLTDNLGCLVENLSSSIVISSIPLPDVQIAGLNNAYSLKGTSVPIQGTPSGGVFSGDGVINNNTFSPALAGVNGSPHAIVYSYVDPVSTCFNSDTVFVDVIDAEASIVGLRAQYQYCNLDTAFLITGTNVTGTFGTFSISGNVGLTDHYNNTATIEPGMLTAGTYTITYSYYQDGILLSIYRDIVINMADPAIITGFVNTNYCAGVPSFTIGSNYSQGTFYGNGVTGTAGNYSFDSRSAKIGLNTISFAYVNSYGCYISAKKELTILPSTKPVFALAENCFTGVASPFKNLTAHSDSVIKWGWTFGEPNSALNTSELKEPAHLYSGPGNYSVRLVSTNLNNCNDTSVLDVHLGNKPIADFRQEKECAGQNEALHIINSSSSPDGLAEYKWKVKVPDGTIVQQYNSKEFSYNFKWNERYSVDLSVITPYGCKDSVTRFIRMAEVHSLQDSSYSFDFENVGESWNIETSSNNNWAWQSPAGTSINNAHSGNEALFSKFNTSHINQQMIASSPCFDFTGLKKPFIELWVNSNTESNQEGARLEYKLDGSDTWNAVGAKGSGINWYNSNAITSFSGTDKSGWTGSTSGWIRAASPIDQVADIRNVKFRLAYNSSIGGNNSNIISFDDFKIGERQKVSLFELFTNLSAQNALPVTEQVNTVLNTVIRDVVPLEYHVSYTGTDSINLDNPADPGARVLAYGIGNVPFGLLNGGVGSSYLYDLNARLPEGKDILVQSLEAVPYSIQISAQKLGGKIAGKVMVSSQEALNNQNLTLYTVVIEDIIVQSGNKAYTLKNVVKKFLPSAAGWPLQSAFTKGEQVEIPFVWDYANVYDSTKIEIVAFIQSNISREVIQAATSKAELITSEPTIPDHRPHNTIKAYVAPNPASDATQIVFDGSVEKPLKLEIFNVNGKLVKSDIIQAGVNVYEIGTLNFVDGLYIIRLSDGKMTPKTYKLVINKIRF